MAVVTDKQFWLGLLTVTAITGLLVTLLHLFEKLSPYWPLSATTILLFTLFSIAAFFAGKMAAKSTNKHLFTNVIMGFTLFKMLLSGAIVIVYHLLAEPVGKLFILPFFLIYLIYTVFETFIMVKQARTTSGEPKTD